MNLAVESPWLLAALGLVVLPLLGLGMRTTASPNLLIMPEDSLSTLVALCLKLCAMAAIAALVLGMAGLYRSEHSVERIGHGAHIVLLLDRSNSMDNTFAGKAPSVAGNKPSPEGCLHGRRQVEQRRSGCREGRVRGNIEETANLSPHPNLLPGGEGARPLQEESKATVARRLLTEFVKQREHDMIGVAEFSTTPLFVTPLTENKAAVQAAIAATSTPALAYTHVSKGLGMALSFFQKQTEGTGSRMVILVSDGAAAIDSDSEQKLREWFKQKQVRLYWLFMRTANSPGIYDKPADSRDDNAQAMPELYLHKFFLSLGIPYQAYEAENPDALKKAIADINQLENLPMHYVERIPKQDLSHVCYGWATALMLLLLAAKFAEIRL